MVGSSKGKSFKARLEMAQKRQTESIGAALVSSLFRRGRLGVFEDYLWVARKRQSDPYPLVRLQLNLLQDLLTAQRVIGEGKELLEKLPSEEHEGIQREIDFRNLERRVIRDIGDGIAWRTFGYDRAALYVLAERPAIPHIEVDGLVSELSTFAEALDSSGGIAVLNCVTNVLRRGDVTVRPQPGEYEFIEVKTGHKTSGRITRQRQDLRRTLELLNARAGEGPDGKRVILDLEKPRLETFASEVEPLLAQAEKEAVAAACIDDAVIVEVTYADQAMELGSSGVTALWERTQAQVKAWEAAGDHVVQLTSQDRYVHAQSYAPFSIFPFREDRLIGLMSGRIMVLSHVNVSAILRLFERHGWEVIGTIEEHLDQGLAAEDLRAPLSTLRKGELTIALPSGPIGRVAYEFLRPQSVVEMYDAVYEHGPKAGGSAASGLPSLAEEHLWS